MKRREGSGKERDERGFSSKTAVSDEPGPQWACSRLWRKAPDKRGCLWRNAEYIQHGTSNPIASVIGLIDLSFKKSRIIALWPKDVFNINEVSWLLNNIKIPNEGILFKEVKVPSEWDKKKVIYNKEN